MSRRPPLPSDDAPPSKQPKISAYFQRSPSERRRDEAAAAARVPQEQRGAAHPEPEPEAGRALSAQSEVDWSRRGPAAAESTASAPATATGGLLRRATGAMASAAKATAARAVEHHTSAVAAAVTAASSNGQDDDVPVPLTLGDVHPIVKPSETHACLSRHWDAHRDEPPLPAHKDRNQSDWDRYHVRLPCSSQNKYQLSHDQPPRWRWNDITKALKQKMLTSHHLQDCIKSYNRYASSLDFGALNDYLEELPDEQRIVFFDTTLPAIAALALRLPELVQRPIPLLAASRGSYAITMSQEQVACLLANAFFCTFPRRTSGHSSSEYATYPYVNFDRGKSHTVGIAKLACVMNYFERVTTKMPTGVITYQRQSLEAVPPWGTLKSDLTDFKAYKGGTIEDHGVGMLQADFANKVIGGGVLGRGAVQEEIRFLICPELILTRLFTEKMRDNEAVLVVGAERYSRYKGYASSFGYAGNFVDRTPRDSFGRRQTQLVAIDALVFKSGDTKQFSVPCLQRELYKAYAGLAVPKRQALLAPFATGNWGCGAFGADPDFKAAIQWLAASAASRDVAYFTFRDEALQGRLNKLANIVLSTGTTIELFYNVLYTYGRTRISGGSESLCDYIERTFGGDGSSQETDTQPAYDERQLDSDASTPGAGAAAASPDAGRSWEDDGVDNSSEAGAATAAERCASPEMRATDDDQDRNEEVTADNGLPVSMDVEADMEDAAPQTAALPLPSPSASGAQRQPAKETAMVARATSSELDRAVEEAVALAEGSHVVVSRAGAAASWEEEDEEEEEEGEEQEDSQKESRVTAVARAAAPDNDQYGDHKAVAAEIETEDPMDARSPPVSDAARSPGQGSSGALSPRSRMLKYPRVKTPFEKVV